MKIVSKKNEKKIRKLEEKLKKARAKFDACKMELNKIYGKIPTNEVNNGRPNQ